MTANTTVNGRWYHAQKAAGLCVKCAAPATHGVFCEAHHSAVSETYNQRKQERRCTRCGEPADDGSVYCPKHRHKSIENRHLLKKEVIGHYGGKCACCGESNLGFLTIDHINNDGGQHRAQLSKGRGAGGYRMYGWLKRHGFPSDVQVLCYNCNCGRDKNGGVCPHQQPEEGANE